MYNDSIQVQVKQTKKLEDNLKSNIIGLTSVKISLATREQNVGI